MVYPCGSDFCPLLSWIHSHQAFTLSFYYYCPPQGHSDLSGLSILILEVSHTVSWLQTLSSADSSSIWLATLNLSSKPQTSLPLSPTFLCTTLTTTASPLPVLWKYQHVVTSGPLHLPFPLSGMLFPQTFTWLASSLTSGLYPRDSSMRPDHLT